MSGTLKDLTPGQKSYVKADDIINYTGGGVAGAAASTALLPEDGLSVDAVEVHMTTQGHVEFRRGSGRRVRWVNLIVG